MEKKKLYLTVIIFWASYVLWNLIVLNKKNPESDISGSQILVGLYLS